MIPHRPSICGGRLSSYRAGIFPARLPETFLPRHSHRASPECRESSLGENVTQSSLLIISAGGHDAPSMTSLHVTVS